MKCFVFTSLLLSSLISFAAGKTKAPGCDFFFAKESLCATLTWTKKPVVVAAPTAKDAAAFDLKFWNAKTSSAKGPFTDVPKDKTLFVSLYMPEMGHGSEPVILKKDEKEAGVYHITQVLFSMEGTWEIRARLNKGAKISDSANYPFNFK
ncbi:MAG TPA: FixH family protein [Bdellovibrio sp.]|uniref:FixH family protein n=1 Tax=Bdellovibrio sp. TaxID=28201 RepID=UPI002F0BC259